LKKFLNSLGVAALLVTGLTLSTTLESKAQSAPSVSADSTPTPPAGKYIAGGSGTKEDPYQLADIDGGLEAADNSESTTSLGWGTQYGWDMDGGPIYTGGSGYGWWYLNI
jgi:hypothetical protein